MLPLRLPWPFLSATAASVRTSLEATPFIAYIMLRSGAFMVPMSMASSSRRPGSRESASTSFDAEELPADHPALDLQRALPS